MDDAVLTGIETRTSAPLRINRNENLDYIHVEKEQDLLAE